MKFKGKDIISIRDVSREDLLAILKRASEFDENSRSDLLAKNVLATLFFEPSTRTRLSFESAMSQLGGKVISLTDVTASSLAKGESLHDTIKIIEGYSDVIIVRHPKEGAARFVAEVAKIPVINAGDGSNQHPTQTCTDLYTLQKEFGDLKKIRIGFVGDLKYGRTVHSLALGLAKFGLPLTFISPPNLRIPEDLHEELEQTGVRLLEAENVEEVLGGINVLYVTRIQKERFSDLLEYERVKGMYQIGIELIKQAPKDLRVMHPLPRLGEISPEVDSTKAAIYFKQSEYGIPVRKALLAEVLGK